MTDDDLMTLREASAEFGIPLLELRRRVTCGAITHWKLGRVIAVTPASVRESTPVSLSLKREGTVYVAGFGPYVKIGFTLDAGERVMTLNRQAPEPIVVHMTRPGSRLDEGRLHARFAEYRTRGEWFRREGALAIWIENGCPYET